MTLHPKLSIVDAWSRHSPVFWNQLPKLSCAALCPGEIFPYSTSILRQNGRSPSLEGNVRTQYVILPLLALRLSKLPPSIYHVAISFELAPHYVLVFVSCPTFWNSKSTPQCLIFSFESLGGTQYNASGEYSQMNRLDAEMRKSVLSLREIMYNWIMFIFS